MRLKNSFFRRTKSSCGTGFTLVEVLIVVVVIAVIAALALPRFFPQREKAVAAEATAMLSAIRSGERSYWYEQNPHSYIAISSNTDPNWVAIELDVPGTGDNVAFDYVVSGNTATATRTARRGGGRYVGRTISINLDDGTWSGDHPFKPKNI